jgi:hypothetical protein
MEEHQTIADLKEYTMTDVKPKRVKNLLEIEVCVSFCPQKYIMQNKPNFCVFLKQITFAIKLSACGN